MKNKLFWGWVAAEVAVAAWFGWKLAHVRTHEWSRKPSQVTGGR